MVTLKKSDTDSSTKIYRDRNVPNLNVKVTKLPSAPAGQVKYEYDCFKGTKCNSVYIRNVTKLVDLKILTYKDPNE